jgi:hypothetical protein
MVLPSWITYDQNTKKLTLITSDISIAQGIVYDFRLETTYESYSNQKIINIQFFACTVPLCAECGTPTTCSIWDSGHQWNSTSLQCEYAPVIEENGDNEIQSAQRIGQVLIGSSFLAGSASAILSSSSSQGAYSSINQFQLYLLIPLIGAFIHKDVLLFLKGFDFSMFSFSFIDFKSIPGVELLLSMFPNTENSKYMQSIGLEYESTVRNIIGTVLLLWVLALIHVIIVTPLNFYSKKYEETHKFRRLWTTLFLFFTFTIYIRAILEAYLLVCLSCVLEFWSLGPNEAIAVFFFVVAFTLAFFIIWNYIGKFEGEISDSYFKELFSGMKPTKVARLYFSTFILRRLISILIIIPGESIPMIGRVILFWSVHSSVFAFTVVVRPFLGAKDNLIEILNDLSYGGLTLILVHFNTKKAWSNTVAGAVVSLMLGISLVTTFIQLSALVYLLMKYLKLKCSKKQKKVKPESVKNMQVSKSDAKSHVILDFD